SGFAQGINAGVNMGKSWIDAYRTSADRQEIEKAMGASGLDSEEIGVDYLKQNFGLDDNAANTMLTSLKTDPTKARSLLNATNMVTGGAAGGPGQLEAGTDALGKPTAVRTAAIDMSNPQGTPLAAPPTIGSANAAAPDQVSRRYADAAVGQPAAGRPTPQSAFVSQYGPVVQSIAQQLNVDPAIIAAKLGHETAWGKSVIPGTNNLANIKDFSGGGVQARDRLEGSNDRYRQYDNTEQFAADYVRLMKSKYPGVVGAGEDVDKFISGMKGYATDPQYGAKLKASYESVRKNVPGGNLALDVVGKGSANAPVVAAAIQTPEGQQAVADDITKMQQVAERVRIPKNAQFRVSEDGKVMMDTPRSDADQYLNVAKIYLRQGKTSEAKQAMDMHFQTKASEAAEYVRDIMQDDSLDADGKIGALSRGTGIRIYKDKDGSYVSPDLTGAPGEGGKHKRLSVADIGQFANMMTTPEGMKYLYGHKLEQEKLATTQRKVALEERQEGTVGTPGSQSRLREAQTLNYLAQPGIERAKIEASAGKGPTDKGDFMTIQPGQQFMVNVPSGKGGQAESRSMTMYTPPAGMQGGSGMMDASEMEKLPAYQKVIADSPYGNPEGSGVRIGIQTNPVQVDPGTKNLTSHAGELSGRFTFPATAVNPATGQREAFGFVDGKPVWASESNGRVPMYRTPEQAAKAAEQMTDYLIGQKKPEANAAKAAAKKALDEAKPAYAQAPGVKRRKQAIETASKG
ncbi:MAG TPA: glucosaminidase domain-containing protein, partial [Ramlibacter sp.]|uniref:glucosaminidase domain-containing protein n=1 Tax=Ramlibacter sp. TaxID=1917967 RepID=UPI002D80CF9D